MIWWKSKIDLKRSIFEPSKLVMSLVYQNFDFVLKLPRISITQGFFSAYRLFWLDDKETQTYKLFLQFLIQNL